MADIRAVAEYFLEQNGGSIVKLQQSGAPRNIIDEAQKILDQRTGETPIGKFFKVINEELNDDEKAMLGDFCRTKGTDTPTLCRLYKIFKASQQ
jgi:hypothetical protein